MEQLTKKEKRARRKKSKQAFKRWLYKNRKAVGIGSGLVFVFICIIIVDIIIYINNPELFEWYIELF